MKGRSKKFTAAIVVAALVIAAVPAVVVASIITKRHRSGHQRHGKAEGEHQHHVHREHRSAHGARDQVHRVSDQFHPHHEERRLGSVHGRQPDIHGLQRQPWRDRHDHEQQRERSLDLHLCQRAQHVDSGLAQDRIPKAGQKLISSVAPACTITVQADPPLGRSAAPMTTPAA